MGLPNSNQLKPETLCNIYRMYVDQAAVVFYVIGQHIAVCIVGYDLLYGLITLSLVYKLMLLIVLCFKRLVFRMWFSDWMGSPFSIVGYGLSYGICSQFLYGGDAVFILLCEIVWVMWIYLVAVRVCAFSQCFVLYSHPLNPYSAALERVMNLPEHVHNWKYALPLGFMGQFFVLCVSFYGGKRSEPDSARQVDGIPPIWRVCGFVKLLL
eukprot:221793_1